MKTLHLLRHAKSSWDHPHLLDSERPLNKRGKRDAPRMGEALRERVEPMGVCTSPARRAQLTLGGVCDAWPELARCEHSTVEALYTFSAADVLDWIREQDDALPALFLVGHNPAFTDVVNLLDTSAELDNLPTAGYARLALDIGSWADLAPACGQLEQLLFPKQL